MRAERLPDNPIVTPAAHASIGDNLNGPSLIRVPDWAPNPLGRYYLYFAHHQGTFIRLAYAERVEGPYRIHAPGTLRLAQTGCRGHIASPDAHVDEERREIRMYFHGPVHGKSGQYSFVACSRDGLAFEPKAEPLGEPYMRVFRWGGWHYALAMSIKDSGVFLRSRNGIEPFERGPAPFIPHMRHNALLLDGDTLRVFYSVVKQAPEHIVCSALRLTPDWSAWKPAPPASVLKPEMDWEGADAPHVPSEYGAIHEPAWQLRDPCVFREGGATYLLYSVAGERGLAIARLHLP